MRWQLSIFAATILITHGGATTSIVAASDEDNQPAAGGLSYEVPPFERDVSLNAAELPLRDAFAEVCRQAGIPLSLDEDALADAQLDLGKRVTITIVSEPLADALARLIHLMSDRTVPDAFSEVRGGALVITTVAARQSQINEHLPDWLKRFYRRGLLADVDDEGNVVRITASQIVDDDLLAQFATLSNLRELHIESTNGVTADGLAHLGKMAALRQLSLYSVNVDGNGLGDEVARAIAGLQNLTDLSINECGITDAGVQLLSRMKQITRLKLDHEGRLTDEALTSVGQMTGLKHLDLSSYVGTEHYGWMRFSAGAVRQLSALQHLEELHLVGQDVPADAIVFDRLTSLSLGGKAVDDACAERIAKCTRLRSLSLSYTAITDAGLGRIATLPELTRLNIDSHSITDDGISHLGKLRNLKHLSLRASQLSDESLTHLAQIKTLARLDLHGSGYPGNVSGDRFTIDGLTRLRLLRKLRSLSLTNLSASDGYIGLKELSQLRVLSFLMCDIDADDADALEAALPNTMIYGADYGRKIRPRK